MQDQICSVFRASFLELRHLTSIWKKHLQDFLAALITSCLDYCNSVLSVWVRNRQVDFRGFRAVQHGLFWGTSARSQNITVKWTALVACNIPLRVQDRNFCVSPLRQYTPLLPFSFAQHGVSNVTHPSILKQEAFKTAKRNLKSCGERSFSFKVPSVWNSLLASLCVNGVCFAQCPVLQNDFSYLRSIHYTNYY